MNKRPVEVTIASEGQTIISVPQRDLFGKYGWPAEERITGALLDLKQKDEQ